ncbi:hypothetical protein LguiB_005578 [Lonicera macranthoides]
MEKIEKAWFRKQTNCPDPSTSMLSNSLGINSFWGLFVIVGVAASFALIIFTSMLIYENKNILMRIHPKDIWKNFITSNRKSGGTYTDSVDETNVCPNLSNNGEETICDQENQNVQMISPRGPGSSRVPYTDGGLTRHNSCNPQMRPPGLVPV